MIFARQRSEGRRPEQVKLSEADPIRIADQWLKAEARPWTLARRRAFFESVRRCAADGVFALLMVAVSIGSLKDSGFLPESYVREWTAPFKPALRYLPDKLLSQVENLSPYVAPLERGRRADRLSGRHAENPATVIVPFSFRGVLPLQVGERIEVDLRESLPGVGDAQFEAGRVVWSGGAIEEKTSQVVLTPQAWKGRIPGIVQSYRQQGNIARFSLTVDRKTYEQNLLPTPRKTG